MDRKDLFPYKNRTLGTEELIFDKSERKKPEHLAIVTIINLKKDDSFSIEGEQFSVKDVSATSVKIVGSLDFEIVEGNLTDNPLFLALCQSIGKDIDSRVEAIEHIIERDPALFRARVGGWILIDELLDMSGNVQYPSSEELRQKEAAKNAKKAQKPDDIAKVAESASRPLNESVQMGFDF